jgi:hypothetical protein
MSDETGLEAMLDEVVADGRSLRSFLDGDESAAAALRGTMLDAVSGSGDDSDRSRTMAAEPGGIAALVTDRRVLFVVDRGDRADVREVDGSDVTRTDVETMGDAVRLTVGSDDGERLTFYPDGADETTVRAAADALETGPSGDADALDRLERLADLRDRGALSDEEFESKKRDLLDDV